MEESTFKNDTVIVFMSPAVSDTYDSFATSIYLDNYRKTLAPFEYHPDPHFNNLSKTIITENSMIIVTVSILRLAVLYFHLRDDF